MDSDLSIFLNNWCRDDVFIFLFNSQNAKDQFIKTYAWINQVNTRITSNDKCDSFPVSPRQTLVNKAEDVYKSLFLQLVKLPCRM